MAYSWECPYCSKHATITSTNHFAQVVKFGDKLANNKHRAELGISIVAVSCPNRACGQVTLKVFAGNCTWHPNNVGGRSLHMLAPEQHWNLWPESGAKPQPDYIPEHIVKAYSQACRIAELSPDASATLSRKCLQGMVRDFWQVSGKRTLNQEIDAIKERLTADIWEAIDGVRRTGNVGAHFDAEPDKIVEVDEGEAKLLIGLIELLFEEWYVTRQKRGEALAALSKLHRKPDAGA